jgi:hypothetical protein
VWRNYLHLLLNGEFGADRERASHRLGLFCGIDQRARLPVWLSGRSPRDEPGLGQEPLRHEESRSSLIRPFAWLEIRIDLSTHDPIASPESRFLPNVVISVPCTFDACQNRSMIIGYHDAADLSRLGPEIFQRADRCLGKKLEACLGSQCREGVSDGSILMRRYA